MFRFKKDDGSKYPEWKKGAFEDFFSINSGYGFKAAEYVDSGIPIVKIDNVGYGKVKWDNISYLPDEYLEKYKSLVLKKDDIVLALNRPITNKQLKIAKLKDADAPAILYQRVGKINCKDIDREFGFQMLGKDIFKFVMEMSVGSDQPFISTERLKKMEIEIPCREEQEKIADFLSSVDDIIQLQEEEITALEEQKKGIMQKLFNREVRFKANDGSEYPEWEERTFDEIFNVIQNNTFSRDCLNDEIGEVLNIHYGDVLIKYGAFIDISKEEIPHIIDDIQLNKFDEKSYLRNGDIIIADTAEDMTVGKATEICGAIGKKILSGLHTIPCRPKETFVSKYLGYYINSEKYHNQLIPLIQGIKVSSISKSNISKTMIIYPCVEEQKKIADCLSAYDEAIQIKKDKLEVWKEIKKGLLQQMFV